MRADAYKVTVAVISHNSARFMEGCLSSVLTHMPYARLVVFDNASHDASADIAEALSASICVIRSDKNVGFGTANNSVMKRFPSDFFLLLNCDAYLQDDVLSSILSYYSSPADVGIVSPDLIFPDGSFQSSRYSFHTPWKLLLHDLGGGAIVRALDRRGWSGSYLYKLLAAVPGLRLAISGRAHHPVQAFPLAVDWVTGACMLLSSSAVRKTGGFDERIFLYGEDEELCFRAHELGVPVHWVPAGPVVHYCGWGENKKTRATSALMRNSMYYCYEKMYKHRPLRRFGFRVALGYRFRSTKS